MNKLLFKICLPLLLSGFFISCQTPPPSGKDKETTKVDTSQVTLEGTIVIQSSLGASSRGNQLAESQAIISNASFIAPTNFELNAENALNLTSDASMTNFKSSKIDSLKANDVELQFHKVSFLVPKFGNRGKKIEVSLISSETMGNPMYSLIIKALKPTGIKKGKFLVNSVSFSGQVLTLTLTVLEG